MAEVDRYELMRQRLARQGNAAMQDQTEAMRRRFASAGGLSSGAAMRVESDVQNKGQQQLAENLQGVDIAQAQEQYQQGEAEKGRQFAAQEAEKQRGFATAERLGSQEFANQQAEKGYAFQAGEGEKNRGLQKDLASWDYGLKKTQIENQKSQFNKQYNLEMKKFGYEQQVDEFNRGMAERIQKYNEQPGLLDKVFTIGTYAKPYQDFGKQIGL